MSKMRKALIAIGTLAFALIIAFIDAVSGLSPDITILYLIPIILATVYVSLSYGLVVSISAALAELIFHTELGVLRGIELTIDIILHFLVFALIALLIGRLLTQLRVIREFEQKRSYDLGIAKAVHASVFASFPEQYKNLAIGSRIAFAKEIGGDYFRFVDLKDKLFFCIADISGKSIAAALFSALLNQAVTDALEESDNLPTIVSVVNSRMRSSLPDDMFVTMFFSFINGETITFINAGHELPLLYSKIDNSITLLESRMSLPISIQADLKIEPKAENFTQGDILLAVTDGVTESPAFRDGPFEKLKALLLENVDANPQDIADTVFNKAAANKQSPPVDDIIVNCIKRI